MDIVCEGSQWQTIVDKVGEDIVLNGRTGAEERAKAIVQRVITESILEKLGLNAPAIFQG
jgi:hypothetical protein